MDYSQKIDEIMQKMQRVLPHKRFVHSISVGYFASSVAMAYGKNSEKAMLAGLLHDCIEDTQFGYKEIENKFGTSVA